MAFFSDNFDLESQNQTNMPLAYSGLPYSGKDIDFEQAEASGSLFVDEIQHYFNQSLLLLKQMLLQATTVGKKSSVILQLATSVSIGIISKTQDILVPLIDLNNRIVAQEGSPLEQDSWFVFIKEVSEENDKYFGIDSDLAASYQAQFEEEMRKKRKL